MRKRRRFLAAAVLCAAVTAELRALGLSTRFGLVTVDNLQPGQVYNTRELVDLPLAITNTSDKAVELKIEVIVPAPAQYPGMEAAGFEPVPDASWVRVSQDEFTAQAGQTVAADVIIAVPDDDRYLGKRYQVQIHSRTVGKGFLAAGLNSTLRFTVARRRATPEELAQRKSVEGFKSVEFDLLPRKVELSKVRPGRKQKIAFKLSNPTDRAFTYYLSSVTPRDLQVSVTPDVEPPPDAGWLTFPKKAVKVKPNKIQPFEGELLVPDRPEYRGKRYIFILNVELPGVTAVLNQVSRIYVTTEE